MSKPNLIRCAIYTRKSSDEGLDQDFNSLDAQHEACSAYVASQRHEGWKLMRERYDDGGVSGGSLERPALKRLLAEIDAGRVQMVVVYKIDRLTRALSDFAKLVDRFEAAGCSFVSVTQAFNTSSSMGRLTLNVLLSFAQFEREVTAERIRDKIAASKKKGLWMGGPVPLGYDRHPDPLRRELVVNTAEAETVGTLFRLYARHGSLRQVEREAAQLGLRSKRRIYASGRTAGGGRFSRGQIYYLLRNPVYRGQIRHKDRIWPGLQAAILDETLWDTVQDKLQAARSRPRGRVAIDATAGQAPLTGKFRDETGDLLTPTHTKRHGRRLRYYISNRLLATGPDPTGWRLPAPAFEAAIARILGHHLRKLADSHALLAAPDLRRSDVIGERIQQLVVRLDAGEPRLPAEILSSGRLEQDRVALTLAPVPLAEMIGVQPSDMAPAALALTAPFRLRRRGIELAIVAGEAMPRPDPVLIRTLHRAHLWVDAICGGTPLAALAREAKISESYLRQRLRLAFLAPALQQAILAGRQPAELSVQSLIDRGIPLDWEDQLRRFAAPETVHP